MGFIFTRELQADLQDVNACFHQSLLPWWEELSVYIDGLEQDVTFRSLPAVVIAGYRALGIGRQQTIAMANLFKTIYFANYIHSLIKDEEEGQQCDRWLQFSILIGDYIFGRILKLLLEAKADELLDDFSRLMCQINEGLVVQHKMNDNTEVVIEMTRSPLYATAFRTAAKLSKMENPLIEKYEELGHNLGMAIELIQGKGLPVKEYLFTSEYLLGSFSSKQENTGRFKLLYGMIKKLGEDLSLLNPAIVV